MLPCKVIFPKHFTDPILSLVEKFSKPSRFLIGLSGGPDSKALFLALKEVAERLNFHIGAAHIDHGWRSTSGAESQELKKMVEGLGCPFFLHKIATVQSTNLEENGRLARIEFFRKVCQEYKYDAVFLGHQKEDQAETILKRLIEGAGHLGIQEQIKIHDIILLRPWLMISKKEILELLKGHQINFFVDPTNLDSQFLRGRLREKVLPFLETQFGKSIIEPLNRLHLEREELHEYMQIRFAKEVEGFSDYLDFQGLTTSFEIRWLLKKWFRHYNFHYSHFIVQKILEAILSNKANHQIELDNKAFFIDRKKLFAIEYTQFSQAPSIKLEIGSFQWGNWAVCVKESTDYIEEKKGWKDAWNGKLQCIIPQGNYLLGNFQDILTKENKLKLSKKWTDEKVPAFLRSLIPVISEEGKCCLEFLGNRKQADIAASKKPKFAVFLRNTLRLKSCPDKIKENTPILKFHD